MIRWRTAAWLASGFIILGAVLQGASGVHTLTGLTTQTVQIAILTSLAAALTVTGMTLGGLPVSTSQAVVGAIIGAGLVQRELNLQGLGKVVLCWIGTPLGGMLFSVLFYLLFKGIARRVRPSLFSMDAVLRLGLVLCGVYGAYALGANNVANVSSFLAAGAGLSEPMAVLAGGLTISLGVLTYSRKVMMTVGRGITPLDGFSALVVVLSQAVTVHIYAQVGVPVSSSQAVVGAVLGIGMVKGMHIIRGRVLARVAVGWLTTPFIAAGMAWVMLTLMRR
jgi:PiT family inorganic phosphate transporter